MKCGEVIFISTYNIQCGISTYTENLTQALQALQCPVAVLANNVLPTYSDTGHGQCEYIRCWDRLTCHFGRVKHEIESRRPRVVHIQFEYGLFAAGYKAFLEFLEWLHDRPVAIVMTPHSIVNRQQHRAWLRRVLKRHHSWFADIPNKVDAVIAHTPAMKKALRTWNFPESKIEIIPHGIEAGEAVGQIEARRKLDLPLDKKIILSFGLITPSKNIHENIRIISRLSATYPELYYVIAGFPQASWAGSNEIYAAQLISQVACRRNMRFDVRFVPHDRIRHYLCAADMYLLNYTRTPASASGNACLSLAYGIPSIASRALILSVLPENGCLKVDVNAPRQVARAIERLLTEPDLGKTLREKALETAAARRWDKIAALHLQVYDKAAASRGS